MRILPGCYGHVNDNHREMEEKGIRYIHDCKLCEILEECVAYYNALSYGGPWEEECEEEEDEVCGQWISEGTEECDWCPHHDACEHMTYESMKAQGLISPSSKES